MRKFLYYDLMISPDADPEIETVPPNNIITKAETTNSATLESDPSKSGLHTHHDPLSQIDAKLCEHLMFRIIEHFTPILFTPPATSHMACTDVFADTWMTLVIQPALENDGVYKPLESLEQLKDIDWAKEGLCPSCVMEKLEEWTEEQRYIWKAMDKWLSASADT